MDIAILLGIIIAISVYFVRRNNKLESEVFTLNYNLANAKVTKETWAEENKELQSKVESLEKELEDSKNRNSAILSQKKSTETRIGQIGENLTPFLDGFKYDPKDCHFFGSPIDFIVFDLDSADPAVVFLEVKTGNSQLSSKQKTIKNLVKAGKVRFEEYRISSRGTKTKVSINEDSE